MKNQTDVDVSSLEVCEPGGKTSLAKLSAVEYYNSFPADEFPPTRTTAILPLMTLAEKESLKEDIKERGVQVPVVLFKEPGGRKTLLDGRHRAQVVRELWDEGFVFPDGAPLLLPVQWFLGTLEEAFQFVFRQGFHMRQMTQGQRAAAGYLMMLDCNRIEKEHYRSIGQPRPKRPNGAGDQGREWASKIGVGKSLFYEIKALFDQKNGDLARRVAAGEISLKEAKQEAKDRLLATKAAQSQDGAGEPPQEDGVAAPAVATPAVAVLDGNRTPVPSEWQGVFLVRHDVAELDRRLRNEGKTIALLCETRAGFHFPAQLLEETIDRLGRELRDGQPHCVCPTPGETGKVHIGCGGTGKDFESPRKKCRLCGGSGFLSAAQHRTLKKDLKAEARSAGKPDHADGDGQAGEDGQQGGEGSEIPGGETAHAE